jgi:hypothetical protein
MVFSGFSIIWNSMLINPGRRLPYMLPCDILGNHWGLPPIALVAQVSSPVLAQAKACGYIFSGVSGDRYQKTGTVLH